MSKLDISFAKQIVTAESKFDKLINLKILLVLIVLTIGFIILYGQWLTAAIMFLLFLYYRTLIIKYRKIVLDIKENGKR